MDVEQDCASYAEHHAADDYFDFGFHFYLYVVNRYA
jgi:hypothetical protein